MGLLALLKKRFRDAIDALLFPIKKAVHQFIDKRTPIKKNVTLQQKKIYILPSRYGFIMLWVVLALFLAGVNYSNSIMLSMGYLMASFFIVSILHTYRNVAGITIEPSHVHNGFAGDTLLFDINLSRSGKRTYESIKLIWEGVTETVSLLDNREEMAHILIPVSQRGQYRPGRLRIETTFPVGLFVCWSYARFDLEAWVYPKAVKNDRVLKAPYSDGHDAVAQHNGTDDFAGLRRYVEGDSPKHVDWKAYARGGKLFTKTFVDSVDQDFWIDWQSFHGLDEESRLSYMCYWVLKFSEQNRYFGLRLPYAEISLGKGERHKVQCLIALAQA